jgi:transposase
VKLDDALLSLATKDEQQSRMVELRFFGGLSIEETAEVLRISPSTVKRDWAAALLDGWKTPRDNAHEGRSVPSVCRCTRLR